MRRRLTSLLWNARVHRPRLPWRLAIWVVLLALLAFVANLAVGLFSTQSVASLLLLVTSRQPAEQAIVAARNVVFVAAQLLVMVGSVYLAGRFVDRRWFRDFGFRIDRSWWLDLGFGLALGAALMTGIFLVELLAGWATVRDLFFVARPDFAFWPWFAWGFVTFVTVGVYEELLFRGYLVTNISEGLTWFDRLDGSRAVALATLATAVLFGIAHAGNPNATTASTVGIALAAFMLAAGYVLTGELAIPIGLHTTWNFFQGTVYGLPVSGTANGVSLVALSQSGPTVVTGGAFGPEAGLVGIVAAALGIGLIAAWVRWREGDLRLAASITAPDLRVAGGERTDERA